VFLITIKNIPTRRERCCREWRRERNCSARLYTSGRNTEIQTVINWLSVATTVQFIRLIDTRTDSRSRWPLEAFKGREITERASARSRRWAAIKGGRWQKRGRVCPVTTFPCNLRPHGVLFPQVPSFNGSSYLRYPGLADTSLSWLELSVTLKPTAPDGVIVYNGHHSDATGDFIALYLSSSHVQFTFDLGTGPATLR